jgi:hypothetical protein
LLREKLAVDNPVSSAGTPAPRPGSGVPGKPVRILKRYDDPWRRRLLDRTNGPWYPIVRLFRQPSPGGRDSVIQQVAAALRERAG